jgi:glycosyltransferase involved in cell wall biosynthesis
LHIVSCSSLIPLKRVALIADILSHITVPAKWTHFGDGPLADALKQKVKGLGGHILVDFKGYVSNKAFLAYLENTAISVFINVSESEGIPVTMMEAIASGVPLIGTDVCGVPEIVTPQTGFLIPVNFDPKTVAEMITREHEKKKIYSAAFRKSITDFYMNYFKDEINHKQLSAKILSVCAA